jgi:hypothetical protein
VAASVGPGRGSVSSVMNHVFDRPAAQTAVYIEVLRQPESDRQGDVMLTSFTVVDNGRRWVAVRNPAIDFAAAARQAEALAGDYGIATVVWRLAPAPVQVPPAERRPSA